VDAVRDAKPQRCPLQAGLSVPILSAVTMKKLGFAR
jgi:hypothetical protein